jgi:asparagine synthase (glutamine-hydrolysing)
MNRLRIVDQSDIPVPFRFPHLGVTLAFNGEIYNWKELRNSLSGPWSTSCDAEVLAASYRELGIERALTSFNGMFSFILVDHCAGVVHAARDRFGKKPLFYAQQGESLYIASEAKALPIPLREISCLALDTLEYDVLEETPLENVKRLEPGCRLELSGGGASPKQWYELPQREAGSDPAELLDELEALLLDSVALRCKAEVPVALQFSGGLDSTLILHACERLGLSPPLYCVTMDEIDHLSVARAAAPKAQIYPVRLTRESFFESLPAVVRALDTPATWTAGCLYQMDKQIASDGGRVVISGEGADELFCGYTRYRVLYWLDSYNPTRMLDDPKLAAYAPLIRLAAAAPNPTATLLDRGGRADTLGQAERWLASYGGHGSLWGCLARTELHTTMQVLLRMADRMAATWSLENRCPFLDYRIAELSTRVPPDNLINERESKSILRDLARRWNVEPCVIDETTKRGLAIPWAVWESTGAHAPASRGAWNRRTFADLVLSIWRESLASHRACPKYS